MQTSISNHEQSVPISEVFMLIYRTSIAKLIGETFLLDGSVMEKGVSDVDI